MKIIKWGVFGAIVVFLIVIPITRSVVCQPNKEIEKVALPLGKVIMKHIEENGLPGDIMDIKGLPYKLECKKKSAGPSEVQKEKFNFWQVCYFDLDMQYYVALHYTRFILSTDVFDKGDIIAEAIVKNIGTTKNDLTELDYTIKYSAKEKRWVYYNKDQPLAPTIIYEGRDFCTYSALTSFYERTVPGYWRTFKEMIWGR